MNKFEQQKTIEVVLYILNETGGIDFYHLFKIIYFAEMKHLAKWGHRILSDPLCAMDYGPVPTMLYDAVKGTNARGTVLADLLTEKVKFAGGEFKQQVQIYSILFKKHSLGVENSSFFLGLLLISCIYRVIC